LFFLAALCPAGEFHGLRVPDGFEVTEFADGKLANDVFCLTVDPRGRVIVSGRGYIRILVDEDGDGRADRAIDFAATKDGAQGLLWEGSSLYYTADGGLRRIREGPDGKADGPPELIRAFKTGGEHDAHAIRRGPDGWLYFLCGNAAGIDARYAQLPTSPIKDPVAGCVVRFTPDLKESEIVADGFRNAYDMDFNRDGELFTFDSDNERCVSLPWYEGQRFYHVVPGGHHGWRSPQLAQFWRLPPYAADVVAPVADLGRGSPTGVVCYRHLQFPEEYRGGFFLLDWTFGRVYFVTLRRSGSTYTCTKRVFLQAVGENGFAPTAAAVHPLTGDLFISIGGRGTRGAVYRIRYPKGLRPFKDAELAALRVAPRSLDCRPEREKDLPRQAAGADALERLRALQNLRRHRGHFGAAVIQEAVRANWDHADRYVRKAAADLVATLDRSEQPVLGKQAQTALERTTFGLGTYAADSAAVMAQAADIVQDSHAAVEARLAAVRLLQLSLGDLTAASAKGTAWEGYSIRGGPVDKDRGAAVLTALRAAFPTGHADLDREVSRTFAMLEDDAPATLERGAARFTAESHPVEDIHYLIVASRLRAPRPAALTARTAAALLALDAKIERLHLSEDSNWSLRIAEVYAELARKDAGLQAALLADKDFGRPGHVLFARSPGFDRRRSAEVFVKRAEADADYPWSPALVELLGSLPEERSLPVLRRLWERGGLEEAILPLLARKPQAVDRERFLAGLNSPQLATVSLSLEALEKLPAHKDGAALLALLRALRRLSDAKEEKPVREHLAGYLQQLTGQEKLGSDRDAWAAWLAKTYPDLAGKLGDVDGVDVAAWNKRLAGMDWSQGEAGRGRGVFVRASCASCHSGGQALGPDLQGVAGRFSRADLFTAILQPSKDVSPRYRTTLIATAEGKAYQGLIIYEATGSLILQTGPETTVRLTDKQISERRVTATSLMPAGLLDRLSDRDIADLYAYLKSLGTPAPEKKPGKPANPRRARPMLRPDPTAARR
jgi:putative membrane-bound dehydrogenase-like protein